MRFPSAPGWVVVALLFPIGAWADEQAVASPPSVSVYFEGLILAQRSWSLGAEPRDLPGARIQAEVRYKRWRAGLRGDATGLPGEFERDKPETFKAVEIYLAGAYDAVSIPELLTAGPAGIVGAGVSLETKEGEKPTMPKALTFGLGARVSWSGGWAIGVVGQHQALRGVAAMVAWQTKISDRVSNIGTVAVGSRAYLATIGVGVRFK